MTKIIRSAGIIMHRGDYPNTEVLLCSPFFLDESRPKAWGIPKGRINPNEDKLDAAIREFQEETGIIVPEKPMFFIGTFSYPSMKKTISAWALRHSVPSDFTFKSNRVMVKVNNHDFSIPEVGEWRWFGLDDAISSIVSGQREMMKAFVSFVQKIKRL